MEGEPDFRGLAPKTRLFGIYDAAFSRIPDYVYRDEETWTQRSLHAHNLDAETTRVAEGKGFALVRRFETASPTSNCSPFTLTTGARA